LALDLQLRQQLYRSEKLKAFRKKILGSGVHEFVGLADGHFGYASDVADLLLGFLVRRSLKRLSP
jgi:hypothetical protein